MHVSWNLPLAKAKSNHENKPCRSSNCLCYCMLFSQTRHQEISFHNCPGILIHWQSHHTRHLKPHIHLDQQPRRTYFYNRSNQNLSLFGAEKRSIKYPWELTKASVSWLTWQYRNVPEESFRVVARMKGVRESWRGPWRLAWRVESCERCYHSRNDGCL